MGAVSGKEYRAEVIIDFLTLHSYKTIKVGSHFLKPPVEMKIGSRDRQFKILNSDSVQGKQLLVQVIWSFEKCEGSRNLYFTALLVYFPELP